MTTQQMLTCVLCGMCQHEFDGLWVVDSAGLRYCYDCWTSDKVPKDRFTRNPSWARVPRQCFNCETKEPTKWRKHGQWTYLCYPCHAYFKKHDAMRPISLIKEKIHRRKQRCDSKEKSKFIPSAILSCATTTTNSASTTINTTVAALNTTLATSPASCSTLIANGVASTLKIAIAPIATSSPPTSTSSTTTNTFSNMTAGERITTSVKSIMNDVSTRPTAVVSAITYSSTLDDALTPTANDWTTIPLEIPTAASPSPSTAYQSSTPYTSSTDCIDSALTKCQEDVNLGRRCANCEASETTKWRRNVCNPCYLYFRIHQSDRPLSKKKDTIHRRKRGSKLKHGQIQTTATVSPPNTTTVNLSTSHAKTDVSSRNCVASTTPIATSYTSTTTNSSAADTVLTMANFAPITSPATSITNDVFTTPISASPATNSSSTTEAASTTTAGDGIPITCEWRPASPTTLHSSSISCLNSTAAIIDGSESVFKDTCPVFDLRLLTEVNDLTSDESFDSLVDSATVSKPNTTPITMNTSLERISASSASGVASTTTMENSYTLTTTNSSATDTVLTIANFAPNTTPATSITNDVFTTPISASPATFSTTEAASTTTAGDGTPITCEWSTASPTTLRPSSTADLNSTAEIGGSESNF